MPTKIRLSRKGKKKSPYYHIVVTDGRAPRDGRFIQKLGTYNPVTNPATIDINFDLALDWLQKGAQPTDTCKAILSYKGILLKKHLLDGVKKGALTVEAAEAKFQAWLGEKESKINEKKQSLNKAKTSEQKKRFEAEIKVKEAKAAEVLKKQQSELAAEAAKEAAENADASEPVAETTEVVEPVAESTEVVEPVVESTDAPVADSTEETKE